MQKNELLKLLILLARFTETTNRNDNALTDAYGIVEDELRKSEPNMTSAQIYLIVDIRCKEVQF